jgi:crotonobetainyl-CoA:carnitine CoA-transferase CaiB-like acyl-CoA transferase
MPLVRERIGGMSKQAVMTLCEQAGLPFSPIQRPEDLFEDRHLNESGGMTELVLADGQKVKVPMLPFEMDGQRFGARLNVPEMGSHSRELLEQIGYAPEAIAALEAAGTIRSA